MGRLGSVFKSARYSQINLIHYSIKCGLQFQVADAQHDSKGEPVEFMPDETDGMHDKEQHNGQPRGDAVTKKMTATMLFFIFLHAFGCCH